MDRDVWNSHSWSSSQGRRIEIEPGKPLIKGGRRRCRKPGRSCVRRIKRHFRRSRRSCAIIANSSTMFDVTLPAENFRYSDATFTTMRSLSPQDE
jgi:hypothetical protein